MVELCCTHLTGGNVSSGYLSGQQVDDLEGVLDDTHGHQLLAVVAAVHHHGVGETLHNGALGLTETFGRITPSRVWQVLGVLLFHCDVILLCTWGDVNMVMKISPRHCWMSCMYDGLMCLSRWLTGSQQDYSQWISKDIYSASTLAHQDNGTYPGVTLASLSAPRVIKKDSSKCLLPHTCREMSLIWTSSVLHLPKSLISGDSATAGAVSHSVTEETREAVNSSHGHTAHQHSPVCKSLSCHQFDQLWNDSTNLT